MYVYVFAVYIHIKIFSCIHTCACIDDHVSEHQAAKAYQHMYVYAVYIHTTIFTCICTCACMYVCAVYIHITIFSCICTCACIDDQFSERQAATCNIRV